MYPTCDVDTGHPQHVGVPSLIIVYGLDKPGLSRKSRTRVETLPMHNKTIMNAADYSMLEFCLINLMLSRTWQHQ